MTHSVLSTNVLSPWTFCPHGRFVRWMLCCRTFCPHGHFVQRMFCSSEHFVPMDVLSPDVLSGHCLTAAGDKVSHHPNCGHQLTNHYKNEILILVLYKIHLYVQMKAYINRRGTTLTFHIGIGISTADSWVSIYPKLLQRGTGTYNNITVLPGKKKGFISSSPVTK
jgi:hypothetical protein